MRYIVGVDIGGTNVVVGTVPEDGSTVHGLCKERTLAGNGRGRRRVVEPGEHLPEIVR